MTIHERIKEVRLIIGFTQSKFAERIAISTSYLAEIEHATKAVNDRIIKLVVAEFDVNGNWLRTGEGEMFNNDIDILVNTVVSLFKSLNAQFQQCAVHQLEELVSLHEKNKKL